METTVKIGVMPGKVQELFVEKEQTLREVIELAELDVDGYTVKADEEKVDNLDKQVGETKTILLVKQVKGN